LSELAAEPIALAVAVLIAVRSWLGVVTTTGGTLATVWPGKPTARRSGPETDAFDDMKRF